LGNTIVLVDDNADDEMLTIRALNKNNVTAELVVLRDGVEALEYFSGADTTSGAARMRHPMLILLDLKLPKVNGLEVLEKLRGKEHTRLIPVVILTTSNEQQDIFASYRLGANSYIRKPVDFNEFTETIRKIAEYWLSLNIPALEQEK
jgi:two-component system response regulator